MKLLAEEIENYSAMFSTKETKVLADLNRETHLHIMVPQMLSVHIQGNFLKMMSFMLRPKRVLEIGTFTGYSAICFASGLADEGLVHTIDINAELEDICAKYFEKSGFQKQIKHHIGNALDIVPSLDETFDLVFIDADKINYAKYYDMVFDKVRKGGYIIADNVLWSGKVIGEIKKTDKDSLALHAYNKKITEDDRVDNFLVPIRDGLMVARKL